MKFYRYDWREYAVHDIFGELVSPKLPNPKMELHEYELKKETPKGYWIGLVGYDSVFWKKWIPKESKKRFAYPTKEEALNNFIKRTQKRIEILDRNLICCKMIVAEAKNKTKL